jgi:hypothetical protein
VTDGRSEEDLSHVIEFFMKVVPVEDTLRFRGEIEPEACLADWRTSCETCEVSLNS